MFIAIMAYHLLCNIEYQMKQKDDYRQWQTIIADLITHQRATIILTDKKDKIHHIRVSGQPDPEHKDIYDKLSVKVNTIDSFSVCSLPETPSLCACCWCLLCAMYTDLCAFAAQKTYTLIYCKKLSAT